MNSKSHLRVETSRDPYAATIRIEICLPLVFRELCRMLEIEPARVLVVDFCREIMQPIFFDENGLAMSMAGEYFSSMKHEKALFTSDQVRTMLYELLVLKSLYYSNGQETGSNDEHNEILDVFLSAWKRKWSSMKQNKLSKK